MGTVVPLERFQRGFEKALTELVNCVCLMNVI